MNTVPIGQREFEDHFRNRAINDFRSEIYGLLLEFDLPELNFNIDNIPVCDYDNRLDYCIALVEMIESYSVNGIRTKNYLTIDPDFVNPLVDSLINLLADTVQAIEHEMDEDAITADFRFDENGDPYEDYEDYMDSHVMTEYTKRLEDLIIDSFGTTNFLPESKEIRLFHAPLDLGAIDKLLKQFKKARTVRNRLRRTERGNINMNMFLCNAFAYGLKPSNQVFEELYEALSLFNLIDPAQAALHNKELTGKSRSHAKGDYLRRRYNYLKSKGLVK